jgi:uncharacterized protein YqjF (DUF2071 family)
MGILSRQPLPIPEPSDRPFLTARWTDILLINFAASAKLIDRLAPPGTEPDLYDGRAYISVVGFRFRSVRVLGIPIPGHTNFDEINLRFYVKRTVGDETRRGVVFVREIVPRRAVAVIANRLYYENYITRPIRSSITMAGSELSVGDTVEYAWSPCSRPLRGRTHRGQLQGGAQLPADWSRLAGRVAAPLALPPAGSLENFIVEHYWGYSRGRDGRTREYRVAHPPWRVAAADNIAWECDVAATYDGPFCELLSVPPASAIIADGSAIQVFRGRIV